MKLIFVTVLLVGVALCAAQNTSNDIEVVGLWDNCGDKSVCDLKSHLTCLTDKCVCDTGKDFVLNEEGTKCVEKISEEDVKDYEESQEEKSSEEEDHSEGWPEDENEWKLPDNVTTNIKEKEEDHLPPPPPPVKAKKVEQEDKKEEEVGVGVNHEEDYENWYNYSDEDDTEVGSPWKVIHSPLENVVKCSEDKDCLSSSLGPLSSCNPIKGECECFDATLKNLKVIPVNGSCLLYKEIGSPCTQHEECSALIKGPAWCHHDLSTGSNFCSCAAFNVWSEELLECLPTASNGALSPCLSDLQCSAHEALGPLGKCSEVTGFCDCEVGLGPYSRKVILFGDKCIEGRNWGEECETDQECEASLGMSSYCHPSTSTCSCLPGKFCLDLTLGGQGMSDFTLLLLLALAMSVLVSSVVCLMLRRRNKGEAYVFIQQQSDV